jgi:hypothetical protein
MSHVLILFQSNTEPLEQMALAVAVGAVEAEGAIRLRRLAVEGAPEVGHQAYGKIKAADLEWADAIVVGLEHVEPVAEELEPLLELLREGGLAGKCGWAFGADGVGGSSAARGLVEEALREAGISVAVPGGADDEMKVLGRLSARDPARETHSR